MDELNNAIAGGEIYEQDRDSTQCLTCNSKFTHAVRAIQELDQVVKQQQEQIGVQQQQLDRLIHITLKRLIVKSSSSIFRHLLGNNLR